jgi:glycosyltransferase involved in cell wall biosynthesis
MNIIHLTASTFYGGPERQMLGLAGSLRAEHATTFLTFAERGRCRRFLEEIARQGFAGQALNYDTPCFRAAVAELKEALARRDADVLCCHGYKADILGQAAARLARIPVVAVSRGWTAESLKVRLYEAFDRLALRGMDRVICVSEGQAEKVRRAGIREERVVVIPNAIRTSRFDRRAPAGQKILHGLFARPPAQVVAAAGRLSSEKGFEHLVEAARLLAGDHPETGFVLFGDGLLREPLRRQIAAAGLEGRFVLAGFRDDLDRLLPFVDVLAVSSLTEGLPNVILEAMAAAVPVVATAVGGVPELVEDGATGYLAPPADAAALAERLGRLLHSDTDRQAFGQAGRRRVARHFTFDAQARAYRELFESLTGAAVRQAA